MQVYIVTCGEYSDYRIQAVFLDAEAAQKYAKEAGSDIEEWVADEHAGETMQDTFIVSMDVTTGEVLGPPYVFPQMHQRDWSEASIVQDKRVSGHSVVSKDHALKIAVEKRQEWLRRDV